MLLVVYAPWVGRDSEQSIPINERVMLGAAFHGHVGEGNTDDEEDRQVWCPG